MDESVRFFHSCRHSSGLRALLFIQAGSVCGPEPSRLVRHDGDVTVSILATSPKTIPEMTAPTSANRILSPAPTCIFCRKCQSPRAVRSSAFASLARYHCSIAIPRSLCVRVISALVPSVPEMEPVVHSIGHSLYFCLRFLLLSDMI